MCKIHSNTVSLLSGVHHAMILIVRPIMPLNYWDNTIFSSKAYHPEKYVSCPKCNIWIKMAKAHLRNLAGLACNKCYDSYWIYCHVHIFSTMDNMVQTDPCREAHARIPHVHKHAKAEYVFKQWDGTWLVLNLKVKMLYGSEYTFMSNIIYFCGWNLLEEFKMKKNVTWIFK